MFGEHIPELMIILVIALLIFGPKKIPEMSASLGKGLRAFNQAMKEQTESPAVETDDDEEEEEEEDKLIEPAPIITSSRGEPVEASQNVTLSREQPIEASSNVILSREE
jgi:sec-independent protein translocase protein TatA